jgi:hypothetical protein
MHNFTPIASIVGGVLIGLAASAILIFDGKVAGISGIVGGLLRPLGSDTAWRAWFLGGLLAGGVILRAFDPAAYAFTIQRSTPAILVAGLLVGFGTRLANGCTSGHGVCGVSRLSSRSIGATVIFLITGGITVFAINHLLGGAL